MVAAGQTGFQIAPVGEVVVVVAKVNQEAEADLPEIGNADGLLAFLLGTGKCGQQQRGQNRDDGDDDEQFNQGEGAANVAERGCHERASLPDNCDPGKVFYGYQKRVCLSLGVPYFLQLNL